MVITKVYPRLLKPPRESFFLFGVRGAGKSTWAETSFREARRVNLLDEGMHHSLLADPSLFGAELMDLRRGQWVVVDELHVYRGIFGAHVHHILRRLVRLCASYGSSPRFLAASATVGNPGEFAGTLVAATFCGMAMWLLSQSGEGFGSSAIPAPQASAMREILVGIFRTVHQPLQWSLFSLGVIFAVILRIVGVPALAFALGMYLPMQLNTPVLLGGILSWVVGRRRGDTSAETAKLRVDRGILIASGLIAGGALMGVFDAFLGVVAFGGVLQRKAALHLMGSIIAVVLLAGFWLLFRGRQNERLAALRSSLLFFCLLFPLKFVDLIF